MRIFAVDRASLLVHVDAHASLREIEEALARDSLTLDLVDSTDAKTRDETLGAWLESGAPGARSAWLDPADHLVAGFTARPRAGGSSFSVKPAPRRAVGPDLLALVLGLGGRMLALESVWLRVHRVSVARPTAPFDDESDEPMNDGERALFDAVAELMNNRS